MTKRYFDIIPPDERRRLQKQSSHAKRKNNVKRHQLALALFEEEGITTVMQVFHVGKEQGYKMVREAKKINETSNE